MTEAIARQTGLLAGVLTFLLRDGAQAVSPSAVAVAGTVSLVAYGALALVPPLWRRVATLPPASSSTSPDA